MKALILLVTAPVFMCFGIHMELDKTGCLRSPSPLKKLKGIMHGGHHNDAALAYDLEKEAMIVQRMIEVVTGDTTLIERACRPYEDKTACEGNVYLYVERCKNGVCMQLDYEAHPVNESTQPIHLPNIYQLEAIYYIFDIFVKDYRINNGVLRKNLNSMQKSNYYRIFMAAIVRANLAFSKKVHKHVDSFLSRYLYMATLYYRTYIAMEPIKTRLQNSIGIMRPLFVRRLRTALTSIIMINLNKFVRSTPATYIINMTKDIPQYFALQRPGIKHFARMYSVLVLDTLVNTLGQVVLEAQQPLYRRVTKLLKRGLINMLPSLPNPVKSIKRIFGTKKGSELEKPYEAFVNAVDDLS